MKVAHPCEEELSLVPVWLAPYSGHMNRSRRSWRSRADDGGPAAPVVLTIVVVAHVDTGPLWYRWIAQAGHHAWLWYGTDAVDVAERLVREASPDVLLVDASGDADPGWAQVRELRRRFPHARLPVVLIGELSGPPPAPHVHMVRSLESAEALLVAVEGAAADQISSCTTRIPGPQ